MADKSDATEDNKFKSDDYRLLEWSTSSQVKTPVNFVHITVLDDDERRFSTLIDYLSLHEKIRSPFDFYNREDRDVIASNAGVSTKDLLLYLLHQYQPESGWKASDREKFVGILPVSVNDFEKERSLFANDFKYSLKDEKKRFEKLKLYIEELRTMSTEYEPIPNSVPVIKSSVYAYTPKIKDSYRQEVDQNLPLNVDENLGDIFFQSILLHENVPLIQYNRADQDNIKTLNVENINFQSFLDKKEKEKMNLKNVIYFFIWLPGSETETLAKPEKISISIIPYLLDRNMIIIDEADTGTLDAIQKALHFLDFDPKSRRDVKIRADYILFSTETVSKHAFYDYIFNYPVPRIFLYTEDRGICSNSKKRIDVHHRTITDEQIASSGYYTNAASVSFTISNRILDRNSEYTLLDGTTRSVKSGESVILINITRANSKKIVDNFIGLFNLLMAIFLKEQPNIVKVYKYFIPRIDQLVALEAERRESAKNKDISILARQKPTTTNGDDPFLIAMKERFGALSPKNLCRIVEASSRPTPIHEDEIEMYKNNGYKIYSYPRENPIHFIIENESAKYFGLKESKVTKILLPHTYSDKTKRSVQVYRAWLKGKKLPPKPKKDKALKTKGIMDLDEYGMVPSTLSDTLRQKYKDYDFYRTGVKIGNSSFLQCIHYVINGKLAPKGTRRKILDTVNIAVCAQEVYAKNMTLEEASELFASDKFIDPLLFYRLLEEYYDINIYLFGAPIGAPAGELIIPYHRMYHSHMLRQERNCVLILVNEGAEKDGLEYPNSEIIAWYRHKSRPTNFNPSKLPKSKIEPHVKFTNRAAGSFIHEMMTKSHRIFTTFSSEDTFVNADEDSGSSGNISEVHQNLYYRSSIMDLGFKALSQHLDEYGKAIGFDFSSKGDNVADFSIMTLPMQPENLPVSQNDPIQASDKIIKRFVRPSSMTNSRGVVDGYWYKLLEFNNAYFIPSKSGKELYQDLPEGPSNPSSKSESLVMATMHIMRQAKIIYEICRYLFEVHYLINYNKIKDGDLSESSIPDLFVQRYFHLDTSATYDFSSVSKFLPIGKTPGQIISKIRGTGLFGKVGTESGRYQNKILMYNQDMYDGLAARISAHYNEISGLIPIRVTQTREIITLKRSHYVVDNMVRDFYSNIYDYRLNRGEQAFVSQEEFQNWYRGVDLKVHTDIDTTLNIKPYMYLQDGKFFLIQATREGNLEEAIEICRVWQDDTVNIGATGKMAKSSARHYRYRLYSLNEIGKISPNMYTERDENRRTIYNKIPYDILFFKVRVDKDVQYRYISLLPFN